MKISCPCSEAHLVPAQRAVAAAQLRSRTAGTSLVPGRKNTKKILTATSEYVVPLILCLSSTGFLHSAESVNIGNEFCLGQQFLWL